MKITRMHAIGDFIAGWDIEQYYVVFVVAFKSCHCSSQREEYVEFAFAAQGFAWKRYGTPSHLWYHSITTLRSNLFEWVPYVEQRMNGKTLSLEASCEDRSHM